MIFESYTVKNIDPFSDAVIGYYYLMYLSKEISLRELLQLSGEEADGGLGATIECEEFYGILNQLDTDPNIEKDSTFLAMITKLYVLSEKIAVTQKEMLEEYIPGSGG